ncbi:hypothetical protein SLEP1_g5526 [Rubroshorea leprosula]|uniref:Uncharacterized protein n=1 Tax=Rubroshorea leprosula TaxID=152421 RepID=A0AAV5I135_9ROSI|nr:hypothetical protein SLEP1_g5526 [Rubroshorea leprosula]
MTSRHILWNWTIFLVYAKQQTPISNISQGSILQILIQTLLNLQKL